MSQPPPPSPPPHASPSKRLRASTLSSDGMSGRSPGPPVVSSWPSLANTCAEKIDLLWDTLAATSMPWETTAANLEGLVAIHTTLCGILDAVELTIRSTSAKFPGEAAAVPPELKDAAPPKPTTPAPTTKAHIPPTKTYAQAAKPRTRRQQGPKPNPTTQKPTVPTDPVRVTIVLKDYPELEVRRLSYQTIHQRLLEAAAKIPGAPMLLGTQWSRSQNLILAFPTGTSRTAIKSLYGCIRSFLGIEAKLDARFDTHWSYVHLANVCAREGKDGPIASEEVLQSSLAQNSAIQALNITVRPQWLRKPELITGTHSSVILAFEDPDGTIEQNLRKTRLYVFGEVITVKKWFANPPGRGKGPARGKGRE